MQADGQLLFAFARRPVVLPARVLPALTARAPLDPRDLRQAHRLSYINIPITLGAIVGEGTTVSLFPPVDRPITPRHENPALPTARVLVVDGDQPDRDADQVELDRALQPAEAAPREPYGAEDPRRAIAIMLAE